MNLHRSTRWLLFALFLLSFSAASFGQVFISVRVGPPALPVYEQPLCPGSGYLWTPGYWAWNEEAGYYWVPGTWVLAPVGMLWTPGYWGWSEGLYVWHAGYWGPHIGFYGGVNYGFGYGGVGFVGGEWRGGAFFYNTAVVRVDTVHVTNVYVNKTVIVHNESHVAFNGGEGGVTARPTHEEEMAAHEHHQEALPAQASHEHEASQNRENFASANHGRPAVAATARPGQFKGPGVVQAKPAGAAYHPPAMSPREAKGPATPPRSSASTPNNRNAGGNRPFTPPTKNQPAANMNRAENTPPRTQNSSHSEPAQRQAPKPGASKPAPHANPPKEERHKGK